MGTTAYGGKGSKGRTANGDRPVGAASCRSSHHGVMPNTPPPQPSPAHPLQTLFQYLVRTGVGDDLQPPP